MPIYDYRCVDCDVVSQFERPLGDLDDQFCPECGGVSKRVFQIFEKQPEIGGGACSSHDDIDGIVADLDSIFAKSDPSLASPLNT